MHPIDGSTSQPLETEISVTLTTPVRDTQPFYTRFFTTEVLRPGTEERESWVFGFIDISKDRRTISLKPRRPLPSARVIRVTFSGLGSGETSWTFETSDRPVRNAAIHPDLISVTLTDDGKAEVIGAPGALPTTKWWQRNWHVWADADVPSTAGLRDDNMPSLNSWGRWPRRVVPRCPPAQEAVDAKGGFKVTVGCPPVVSVDSLSSFFLHVVAPDRGEESFEVSSLRDKHGIIVPGGAAVSFTTPDGIEVRVPPNVFKSGTSIWVTRGQPTTEDAAAVPADVDLGAVLDFQAREAEGSKAGREMSKSPAFRIPIESDAPPGTLVLVCARKQVYSSQRWSIIDLGRLVADETGKKWISTALREKPDSAPFATEHCPGYSCTLSSVKRAEIKAFFFLLHRATFTLFSSRWSDTPPLYLFNRDVEAFAYEPVDPAWSGYFILPAHRERDVTIVGINSLGQTLETKVYPPYGFAGIDLK